MSRFFKDSQTLDSTQSPSKKGSKNSLTTTYPDDQDNSSVYEDSKSSSQGGRQSLDVDISKQSQRPYSKSAFGFRSYHSLSAGVITTRSFSCASSTTTVNTTPGTPSSVCSLGSDPSSPQIGRKLPKWRQVGDRTKFRTKDIIKKWQSMANGKSNTKKSVNQGLESISNDEESTEKLIKTPEKPQAGNKKWKVYVWSTWVRRPYEDEDEEREPDGKIFLSEFQLEKFQYYFTDVFDHNRDRVITIEDIEALNERMRHYAGWPDDNEYYLAMKEIHSDFFECLLEQVGKIEPEYGFEFDIDRIPDRVDMQQWLNMWGNLIHGAKAMIDFPIWLQILPRILFKVINRKDNGIISYEELRNFYRHFIKLKPEEVDAITEEAYDTLTSCNDFPITEKIYLMAFANFLLGKTPQGPGKYIFGGFNKTGDRPFQIDYSCLKDPVED